MRGGFGSVGWCGRVSRIFVLAAVLMFGGPVAESWVGPVLPVTAPVAAAAEVPADAGSFLSELSQRAITELTEEGLAEDEKQRRVRRLLNEGFDVPAIARFVLGR